MTAVTRTVKMIAPTYIKGVVADVGVTVEVPSATAAEFVSHGRAEYSVPGHNDTQAPPAAALQPALADAVAAPATLGLKAKPDRTFA